MSPFCSPPRRNQSLHRTQVPPATSVLDSKVVVGGAWSGELVVGPEKPHVYEVDASRYALSTAFILVCQPAPRDLYQASTSASTRSAICSLSSSGAFLGRPRFACNSFNPVWATAPSQKDRTASLSFTSYGTSAWRICFEICFLLICLSTRDHSGTVLTAAPDQYHNPALQPAQTYQIFARRTVRGCLPASALAHQTPARTPPSQFRACAGSSSAWLGRGP